MRAMGRKLYLVSLGCPKNQVDSEVMMGMLIRDGWVPVDTPEEADLILVNTCAFLQEAVSEAIETILEMAMRRRRGSKLVVAGCLPQRYGVEVAHEIPEVDLWIGPGDIPSLPRLLRDGKKGFFARDPSAYLYDHRTPRVLFNNPFVAYVKIAEGCSHRCAFCIIPQLRGRYRSRDPRSVVEEVRGLVGRGVKEVVLVAQDTTAYGRDLGFEKGLEGLLEELLKIDNLHWLRFLYTYPHPRNFSRRLLELLASGGSLVPYLDLPIQHVSDRVLRRMRRRTTGRDIRRLIEVIKASCPQIALRATVMVGFPGEGDEDFRELLDFVEEAEFTHLGAFKFSPEEGTEAAAMPDRPPQEVVEERFRAVMELQQGISLRKNREWLGKKVKILVEGTAEGGGLVGRTAFQAPEIDGVTLVEGGGEPGDFVSATIVDAGPYDLRAKVS